MQSFLLSICIPTFNRAEYLKKSLETLVSQDRFSEIEVVISDNCSTDNTEKVCKEFIQKYPNIIYHCNSKNIYDSNFPTVLMKGKGLYRKLVNDNTLYCNDYISFLLDLVEKFKDLNVNKKPQFVFLNETGLKMKNDYCAKGTELSDFVKLAGYRFTWIGSFGLWKEDCNNLEDEFLYCNTNLWQSYKTLKILSEGRSYLLFNRKICNSAIPVQKNLSYGIYTVFYKNFLDLLFPYVQEGKLNKACISYVKKDLLFNYFGKYIFVTYNNKDQNDYGQEKDFKDLILSTYKREPYYFKFRLWLFFYLIKNYLLSTKKKIIVWVKNCVGNTGFGKGLLNIKRKLKLKLY